MSLIKIYTQTMNITIVRYSNNALLAAVFSSHTSAYLATQDLRVEIANVPAGLCFPVTLAAEKGLG